MNNDRAHAWLRALLCIIALGACKPDDDPATQIIVSVNSDLAVGSEISRVRIEIKKQGSSKSSAPKTFNLGSGSGRVRLPFSFGIQKGSEERITVIATGFGPTNGGAEGAVIERKANARFKDGEALLLKLFLDDVCLGNLSCEGDETCQIDSQRGSTPGACGEVREPDDLDPIEPGDEDDAWDESEAGAGGEGGEAGGVSGEGGAGEGGAGEGGEGGAGEGGAGEGGAGVGGEAGGVSNDCIPECIGDEECIDQTCVCPVPTTTYYFDADGDDYGDPSRTIEGCGVAPDGYVEEGGDCCDNDDAAYPESEDWSFIPSACGIGDDGVSDWDFDCDGTIEGIVQVRSGTCCEAGYLDGWLEDPPPFCGEEGTISICNPESCLFEDTPVFQECW